jgi:hypothetical protein
MIILLAKSYSGYQLKVGAWYMPQIPEQTPQNLLTLTYFRVDNRHGAQHLLRGNLLQPAIRSTIS